MNAITLSQAEGDDVTTENDFRQVGLVVDPTTFGTSTIGTSSTARQTYVVKGSLKVALVDLRDIAGYLNVWLSL